MDSFNFLVDEGLPLAVRDLDPVVFDVDGQRVSLTVVGASLGKPTISRASGFSVASDLYPRECRERRVSYKGDFTLQLSVE